MATDLYDKEDDDIDLKQREASPQLDEPYDDPVEDEQDELDDATDGDDDEDGFYKGEGDDDEDGGDSGDSDKKQDGDKGDDSSKGDGKKPKDGEEGLYKPSTKRQKLGIVRSKVKKNVLIFAVIGSGILVFVMVISFLLSSLKLPHFVANVTAYEFARLSRNFSRSVTSLTEEKLAADLDNTFAQSLKNRYGELRSSTWGKLDKYRPQKVLDNLKTSKELEFVYESKPRTILPGSKQVLTGIKIGGDEISLASNPRRWYDLVGQRADRLKFSAQLEAELQVALKDSNSLVRGKVAKKIREELGIKLRRWEKLTKTYRNAREAHAAQLKETYEKTLTESEDDALVDSIDDAEKVGRKAADECMKDAECRLRAASSNGDNVAESVAASVERSLNVTAIKGIVETVSTVYAIALPVCMIFEGSVENSGGVVNANSDRAVKTWYTIASGADQQKAGEAPPMELGGLNDELGDISTSPSEIRASGETVNTNNYPNPEGNSTQDYTIFNALFGGAAGFVFNKIFSPSCPVITNPLVGAGLGALEFAIAIGSAGTVKAGEEAAALTAKQVIQQMIKTTFTKKGLSRLAVRGAVDASIMVGGTLIAKLIVANRMGNMASTIPTSEDLAIQADQGANIEAGTVNRQQLYGRPMNKQEIAASKYQDYQDIAYANSQKSVFERYLDPQNPTSMLTNTALSINTGLRKSVPELVQGLLSKISNLFSLETGFMSVIFGNNRAAAATTDNDYGIIQWGWTEYEMELIEQNPDKYGAIVVAEDMENSGKLEELKEKYDHCFTTDMGTLLSERKIERDSDGNIKDNEGECAPDKLSYKNEEAFLYRIYMRNNGVLDHLGEIQSPTASESSPSTPGGPTLTAPGLNGYTIPCTGLPEQAKVVGARDDSVNWTSIQDSGTIGTNSDGQPIKVYIRNACTSENLKTIIVVSSIHASENYGQPISFELLFKKDLPENLRIIAIPELNGYGLPAARVGRVNKNGVNLNRNFDYRWSEMSGDELNSGTTDYRGQSPASEPETQAMTSFLPTIGDASLLIIYHDNLKYVAPVGNTAATIASAYASATGMHGQCPGKDANPSNTNCAIVPVNQKGSLDGWYNKTTNKPTLLVEMPSTASDAWLSTHADALINLVTTGKI